MNLKAFKTSLISKDLIPDGSTGRIKDYSQNFNLYEVRMDQFHDGFRDYWFPEHYLIKI